MKLLSCLLSLFLFLPLAAQAELLSPEKHFSAGVQAYCRRNWKAAEQELTTLTQNFSPLEFPKEAYFYLGVAYFYQLEYEYANDSFNQYLKIDPNPHFLNDTVTFKFATAEAFRTGAGTRVFSYSHCPKWLSGHDMALRIYDEIIATLPSSDTAARALFSKGCLLCQMRDYRCSIDAFLMLIRRFAKHELVPDSYLAIHDVYLIQASEECQNPDLLVLAELSLVRFAEEYPNDSRLVEAKDAVNQIKEVYAWGLYSTGCFFEKTCKNSAAILYYKSTISQFPDTNIASRCIQRLKHLGVEVLDVVKET